MGEVGTKTWIALRRVAMLVDFFWDDGDEGGRLFSSWLAVCKIRTEVLIFSAHGHCCWSSSLPLPTLAILMELGSPENP